IGHYSLTTDVTVDLTGRTTIDGGIHQEHLGGTGYTRDWNRTHSVSEDPVEGTIFPDVGHSVVQTADGGYAIAGYQEDPYDPEAHVSAWLVKTDWVGNIQWNRTYTGGPYQFPTGAVYSVVQTFDGGYALAGRASEEGQDWFWLLKTDSAGYMEWEAYDRTEGTAYSVVQTFDGGYALAGTDGQYFYLVKRDPTGAFQWDQTYGVGGDVARSVVQTLDGGYALAGYTGSGAGANDFWLVKTDSAGNMQWNQTYGGVYDECAYSVVQTVDGGYALAGWYLTAGDMWLFKTDSAGNMEWNQIIGGVYDECAYSVVQTVDGGYALAGYTTYYGDENYFTDFLLVKTDSEGNVMWSNSYGTSTPGKVTRDDVAYSMVQTQDEGYIMVGSTEISPYWEDSPSDLWLVKINPETGLVMTGLNNWNITLYRGRTDPYWNYVRVRIWTIEEPTWMFGDINQNGIVDIQDLAIVAQNYGKTFSLLSLTGIIAVAGVHQYKKRKQPN
ncbi:MAG: hypothetical protein OEY81_01300, partial [Candidatus Bathyarchaeota archaeon]|nr:hypothetical protein [Candidatus Bathyarchaeota archaeon]